MIQNPNSLHQEESLTNQILKIYLKFILNICFQFRSLLKNRIHMNKILLVLIFFIHGLLYAQDLSRRASWDATIEKINTGPGVVVEKLNQDTPMYLGGVRAGDIILMVDGRLIESNEDWTSASFSLRSDSPVELLLRRGGETLRTAVNFNALTEEQHTGLDTYYESITSDFGIDQRVIITKPQNKKGRQPAIFIVQGLSCGTVELYEGPKSNWAKMIQSLVEDSGMVVMRVDKPGVGDSEGNCAETDFLTELEGYRSALRFLKEKVYVDSTKIVIYGSSVGSALAPLLANEFNPAGIISDGTFYKTWFEHMLEIERRIRKMSGDNETTIVKKLNKAYIPLYYGMLIQKKSYGEVVNEYPAIKDYNYHSPEHMYGRPLEYYQQLQEFDLAGEWKNLKVPVRILRGENDWIMSEFDNYMIMDLLDEAGHEDHRLHIYPGLDHWNTIHEEPEDSFYSRPAHWDPGVPELVIKWAKEMVD